MKKGTMYLKERRKMRHKASIFRFLALQRKALQGFMQYQTRSQEQRVKKDYAIRLYYKRMLDLGFSCLKIYAREKQLARAERRKRRETSKCMTGEVQLEVGLGSEPRVYASHLPQRSDVFHPETIQDRQLDDSRGGHRGGVAHVDDLQRRSAERLPIPDQNSRHDDRLN